MADLDRLLRPDISQAAADAAQPPDFTTIRRRGVHRRRTHTLLAAVAAVVVLIAVAGGVRALGTWESAPPGPAQEPSPRSLPFRNGAIEPGTYLISSDDAWSAVDYTITFPEGWRVRDGQQYDFNSEQVDEAGILPFVVDGIFADACQGERGAVTKVGPSARDLVAALLAQPGPAKSRPVQTTLGGYPATRIDLRIPKRLQTEDCGEGPGTGMQIWRSQPAGYLWLDPEGIESVYVVDVAGERQVFTSHYRPARTSEADQAELQQVLDSIEIQP